METASETFSTISRLVRIQGANDPGSEQQFSRNDSAAIDMNARGQVAAF
jgi:hypothetical protein